MYGDILRVDLSKEKVTSEVIPREVIRKFVGGEGINDYLFWEHFLRVDPRIDPLSEDNVMVIGLGPLGATCFGQGSKTKFTFKGPAYNLFADSVSGGDFGSNLRWSGHDHVVITGRAKRPSYLYIKNDSVELRDASHLLGKSTGEAHKLIIEELGDEGISTATIGPAAEKGVTISGVAIDAWRMAGRTGAGAVLWSKNLKAMAARGTKGIRVHDPRAFLRACLDIIQHMSRLPVASGHKQFGTTGAIVSYNRVGSNAWRNSTHIVLPPDRLEKLMPEVYTRNFNPRMLACSPGCCIACTGVHDTKGHETPLASRYKGMGHRAEYLTLASFGAMCDIADYAAVNYLHKLVSEYDVDELEMGNMCGLLMELWERGIITQSDIQDWMGEPVSFEWGNVDAVERVIKSVALQSNKLGEIFKGGMYQGAKRLEEIKGVPILRYAAYGKGGSVINEEQRPFPIWQTNMAVASRGCCHLKAPSFVDKMQRQDVSQAFVGRPEAGEGFTPTMKGAASAIIENITAAYNCLGVCILVAIFEPINMPIGTHVPAYQALTGVPMTAEELYLAGERTYNLEKAFNSRLGYTREQDTVCEKWMKEPLLDPGPTPSGIKAEDYLDYCLTEYYQWKGWDPATGLQRRENLEKLDMKDVADILEREGHLASSLSKAKA